MKSLKFLLALFLAGGNLTARADAPSVHGMLLFGDNTTYASHLPMFHSPHDYQVLLQLQLTDLPHSKTLVVYQNAKKTEVPYFTLVPEVMDLTQVISGAKTSFNAEIFAGHFEQGGKSLGHVQVKVAKVIFSTKIKEVLDPADVDDTIERYFAFGHDGEYYGLHLVQQKPSFDAVVKIAPVSDELYKGCPTRNPCEDPKLEPAPDSELPAVLPFSKFSTPDPNALAFPKSGDVLNSGLMTTHIEKVLYQERADLGSH